MMRKPLSRRTMMLLSRPLPSSSSPPLGIYHNIQSPAASHGKAGHGQLPCAALTTTFRRGTAVRTGTTTTTTTTTSSQSGQTPPRPEFVTTVLGASVFPPPPPSRWWSGLRLVFFCGAFATTFALGMAVADGLAAADNNNTAMEGRRRRRSRVARNEQQQEQQQQQQQQQQQRSFVGGEQSTSAPTSALLGMDSDDEDDEEEEEEEYGYESGGGGGGGDGGDDDDDDDYYDGVDSCEKMCAAYMAYGHPQRALIAMWTKAYVDLYRDEAPMRRACFEGPRILLENFGGMKIQDMGPLPPLPDDFPYGTQSPLDHNADTKVFVRQGDLQKYGKHRMVWVATTLPLHECRAFLTAEKPKMDEFLATDRFAALYMAVGRLRDTWKQQGKGDIEDNCSIVLSMREDYIRLRFGGDKGLRVKEMGEWTTNEFGVQRLLPRNKILARLRARPDSLILR